MIQVATEASKMIMEEHRKSEHVSMIQVATDASKMIKEEHKEPRQEASASYKPPYSNPRLNLPYKPLTLWNLKARSLA